MASIFTFAKVSLISLVNFVKYYRVKCVYCGERILRNDEPKITFFLHKFSVKVPALTFFKHSNILLLSVIKHYSHRISITKRLQCTSAFVFAFI